MSQVVPFRPERLAVGKRSPLTAKERGAVAQDQKGLCGACGATLGSHFIIDHDVPRWINGLDHAADGARLVALCIPCDKRKTKSDQGVIAKLRRIIKRATGERRERKKIPAHVNPWPPKGRKLRGRGF